MVHKAGDSTGSAYVGHMLDTPEVEHHAPPSYPDSVGSSGRDASGPAARPWLGHDGKTRARLYSALQDGQPATGARTGGARTSARGGLAGTPASGDAHDTITELRANIKALEQALAAMEAHAESLQQRMAGMAMPQPAQQLAHPMMQPQQVPPMSQVVHVETPSKSIFSRFARNTAAVAAGIGGLALGAACIVAAPYIALPLALACAPVAVMALARPWRWFAPPVPVQYAYQQPMPYMPQQPPPQYTPQQPPPQYTPQQPPPPYSPPQGPVPATIPGKEG